jgi:putative transposase
MLAEQISVPGFGCISMPRKPRIHLDDVPLHVIQRGHNRQPCFFSEGDYECYLHWLGEALVATGASLHAYALMTNHVHLLITPKDARAIPQLFISLGRRYVQYINRKYQRTGTLWDSRYKSSFIEAETYLFACHRYIELNPVRAAIVEDPAHYRWSSYRHNALGQPDPLLSPRPEYLALALSPQARQDAYRVFIEEVLDQAAIAKIRAAANQSQPLGNPRFYAMIERSTGQSRVPRPPGRPPKGALCGSTKAVDAAKFRIV